MAGWAGLLDGVSAEQVVETEPAGSVLGDEVRLGELVQGRARLRQ